MDAKLIPILTDGLKEYSSSDEISELFSALGININLLRDPESGVPLYHRLAIELITKIDHRNNRKFLDAIVPSLLSRATDGVAHNSFERKDYHYVQVSNLATLSKALNESSGLPEEITVAEGRPFLAKSEVREFLAKAETPLVIVDNYIGIGTLDCLRDVTHPIRLLTGEKSQSIELGFDRALKDFASEGHNIEIRQHPKLHDRFISFNEKCWLLGSSLKDASKKSFNVIEFVDARDVIVQEIQTKWNSAQPYTP
jgi:hypothetical protein